MRWDRFTLFPVFSFCGEFDRRRKTQDMGAVRDRNAISHFAATETILRRARQRGEGMAMTDVLRVTPQPDVHGMRDACCDEYGQ
jgi:hypothetical protein